MKDSDKVHLLAQAFSLAEAYGAEIHRKPETMEWLVTFPSIDTCDTGIERSGKWIAEKFVQNCRFYGLDAIRWAESPLTVAIVI